MPARIAFYDMDKTVTRSPTWTRFLLHAARKRAPWRLALFPAAGVAGLGYMLGLTDRSGLKRFTQRLMVGKALSEDAMAALAREFARDVVADDVLAAARARIAADKAEGYRLVLATASHRYYAAEIAKLLGFDDCIATNASRDPQGLILPAIEGENCYGPAKLRMILAFLRDQGLERQDLYVRAYSDHVSDAPMLEWADEAFAVNAHGPLAALAKERGWTELDWR